MWLRLRQIALVAHELGPVEDALLDVLGLRVCYNDPGVGTFGLHNALYPVGNQFIEVVAPIDPAIDTAGGRYLARRGGDGGYMVITQCDDATPRRARFEELNVRLVSDFVGEHFINMQMHPKDTGGSFFEIDEMKGPDAHDRDGPWHPAGPDWKPAVTSETNAIVAAEMQCDDPAAVARRWSAIAEIDLTTDTPTLGELALENATLRFVTCEDGRPEGLSAIDIATDHAEAILTRAEARNVRTGASELSIGGVRINLV